mgnify:CR=1 FL=1
MNRKTSKHISKKNKTIKKPLKSKSFSPSINKKLNIKSFETKNNSTYNNVKQYFLKKLKYSKELDANKLIAPKQIQSNCWFNTMFVVFFFSDKGRKFFKFLRHLMITGKKFDNTPIENENIKDILFILNIFIEISYNQKIINKYKNIKDLNTNFFIKKLYDIIKSEDKDISIPNTNEAGNPLLYYLSIINFLKYNILKISKISITKKEDIYDIINLNMNNIIHDIIILEDFESESNYKLEYTFTKENQIYKYKLDSIILTNKKHFDENSNSHFVCVLTINNKEYKFDGSSYSKLSHFNWKPLINKNKDWTFKENPNYYPEKYNFIKGYKLMFYYRI